MRHLSIFISLIFLNHISYADVTAYVGSFFYLYSTCAYQGTVVDLNKINSDIELSINIKDNLDSKSNCSVPLNENIYLLVPANNEKTIGSDVKFTATKVLRRVKGDSKDTTGFIFRHWVP